MHQGFQIYFVSLLCLYQLYCPLQSYIVNDKLKVHSFFCLFLFCPRDFGSSDASFFSKLHLPIKKLHTRKSNGGFLALKRSLSHWQKGTYIPVEMTLTKKRADYSVFKEMDQQSSSTT